MQSLLIYGVIAYFLLAGVLPFDHKDSEILAKYFLVEEYRMTIRADIDFEQECWSKVSSEGIDFVMSTFNFIS
jgi:hypothetical protein